MAHLYSRVLYLGRNQVFADDLRGILCTHLGAANGKPGKEPNGAGPSTDAQNGAYDTLLLEVVSNQKSAMPVAQTLNPSLIVIETSNKPDSRLRFCQWLRERIPTASIVAIGSTVLPYRFDFDGILHTPIDAAEVIQLISRLRPARPSILRLGEIELDITNRRVCTPHGNHELTPKECALLQMLMERAGRTVRRADIINQIWETSYLDDTRTLDVHVRWLRRKVEADPSYPKHLITRRGEGYLFRLPTTEPA